MFKKMPFTPVVIFLILLSPGFALASDSKGEVSSITILLGLLAAVVALGCFFLAWRIYTFLKRGELASSWQMLGLSFLLFGLAQLLEIASLSGWLPLSLLSVTFVRLVALSLLAFGLHRTTKVLG